ncbi:MAG: ATP-binding protein, partial [Pseudomonadota bacterium]
AIEDGLRQPDAAALASLSEETRRLGGLVDDLHQLALADAGGLSLRLATVNLAELLDDIRTKWQPRFEQAGLALAVTSTDAPSAVIDRDRFRQALDNLLSNSLRYTSRGGQCRITAAHDDGGVVLRIDDSAPGVPDDALPRLFDRLYRVDASRSRETGASGLGLAIVRSLIEAHGGTASAAHSDLGGLAVTLRLPAEASA